MNVLIVTDTFPPDINGVAHTLEKLARGLAGRGHRVEVITTSFKKAERTGVLLKASAIALVEIRLELGPLTETVTVSAEALSNITLESQAIARGVDEQQIRDLPRNSRDIQSFLGFANFYRRFIHGYSDIVVPLSH